MIDWWWSVALTVIGVAGFRLAGRRVWWCWYVNIANQALWLAYALVTEQWGFLLGVAVYGWVFTRNAIDWTREHFDKPCSCWVELGQGAGLDVTHREPGCPRHSATRS